MQGEDTSFNIPSWRGVMQNEHQGSFLPILFYIALHLFQAADH